MKLPVLFSAAILAASLLSTGWAASASTTPSRAITLTQQKPPAQSLTTVVLRGRLTGSPKKSTVLIERRSGSTWATVKTLRTDAGHRFGWTFRTVSDRTWTYRARAPRTGALAAVVSAAVTVKAHTGWSQLALGGSHRCGLTIYGRLWCWGANSHGQLGNGATTDATAEHKVQVVGGRHWRAVAAGGTHTCAIGTDGSLWCWGGNSSGQLGIGTTKESPQPRQVGRETTWHSVSASTASTCALKTDHSAWCWGADEHGQLGIGSNQLRTAPARVGTASWSRLSMDPLGDSVCGLRTDRTVWCWGAGADGQLGNGTLQDRSVPTQESTKGHWTTVALGPDHACALNASGQAACWGVNSWGQLGWGGGSSSSEPVAVAGANQFSSVSAGAVTSCAIDGSHQLWCWGYHNEFPTPTPYELSGGWRSVSATGNGTCGLQTDDSASCWDDPWGLGV